MYKSGKGPLQLVFTFESFMKWGLDYMGPIKLTTHCTRNQYIIVAKNYTTKWVEGKVLQDNIARNTVKFLYENIIAQFGCPTHLVSDQKIHFINSLTKLLVQEFMITRHKSTTYYPQRKWSRKTHQ